MWYGLGYLSRAAARDKVRQFDALCAANAAKKEDRTRWLKSTRHMAGL